jgi:hypothetical protein
MIIPPFDTFSLPCGLTTRRNPIGSIPLLFFFLGTFFSFWFFPLYRRKFKIIELLDLMLFQAKNVPCCYRIRLFA